MHLATTLLVSAIAACFLPTVGGIHVLRSVSLAKRGAHKVSNPQAIVQRQHHVHRDILDVCLAVDASVLAPILFIIDPLAAKAHVCLCIKDLDIFLDSDIGILLGNLLGKDGLAAEIKVLINTSPQAQYCTFPSHSHRLCVAGHPCAFECDTPYIQSGKACVCPPPMIECNGQCGVFPHGCGPSAAPHPPEYHGRGPITAFSQAEASCKPKQSVCGIPGREEATAFECIDTRIALDSCGGCITPHRFPDAPAPSVKGIDCGHLHGVVTASCINSRCVISQCRPGWHLNAQHSDCVDISAGLSKTGSDWRKRKGKRNSDLVNEHAVIASELSVKLKAYGDLVINLSVVSSSVPTPRSQPPINQINLVNSIVAAAINLLNSTSVLALVNNVNIAVSVNSFVVGVFDECKCVGASDLGLQLVLQKLIVVVDTALDIKQWCSNHNIGVPYPQSSEPSTVSPAPHIPNKTDTPLTVGLDDVLNDLSICSKGSRIDIYGLGESLSGTGNNLLDAISLGPENMHRRSSPTSTTGARVTLDSGLLVKMHIFVKLVVALKGHVYTPHTPPSQTIAPTLPLDLSLLDNTLFLATNLLNSKTVASFVTNLDALVSANVRALTSLKMCKCVEALGLDGLVESLEAVVDITLEIQSWCAHYPVGLPVPHTTTAAGPPQSGGMPTSTPLPYPSMPPNAINTAIIVDLDQLLVGLNLVSLLGGADLSANVELDVDSTVLKQVKVAANLALIIKNGSGLSLPAAPHRPPIISGGQFPSTPAPVDTNLVEIIVQSTIKLCSSGTVADLLANLELSAEVGALAKSSLSGCGCVKNLGLEGLVRDVDNLLAVVVNLQGWCSHHPVAVPNHPHGTSLPVVPSPTSTTHKPTMHTSNPRPPTQSSNISIHLGLDGLLDALGANLSTIVDVNVELNDLLREVVTIVINIRDHSSSLPPALPSTATHPSASVPVPRPPTTPLPHQPITRGLIDELLEVVSNLLCSIDGTDVSTYVNILLHLTAQFSDRLNECECVSHMGLEPLVLYVDSLLDALLKLHVWCLHHPDVGEGTGSSATPLIIDAKPLLSSLGLENIVGVHGTVDGLGPTVNQLGNSILGAAGLGGLRRWLIGR